MICPKCGSDKVAKSHLRRVEKLLRYFIPLAPYRCKECWRRFWKFRNPFKTLSSKLVAAFLVLLTAAAIAPKIFGPGEGPSAPSVQTTSNFKGHKAQDIIKQSIPDRPRDIKIDDPQSDVLFGTDMAESHSSGETDVLSETPETLPDRHTRTPGAEPLSISASDVETPPETPDTSWKPQTPPPIAEPRHSPPPLSAPGSLRTLHGEDLSHTFKLTVTADRSIDDYSFFFLSSPPRLAINLIGNWNYLGKSPSPMPGELVQRLRVGAHKDHIRLVLDLRRGMVSQPIFQSIPNGLEIVIYK